MATKTLTITRPDDWHLHVRDGDALNFTVPHSARQFARAIIMPNLATPVTTTKLAAEYRKRIIAAIPDNRSFEPLMTLYLTDNTPADEIKRASDQTYIHAVKYYPAGATTHADNGVTDIRKCYRTLEAMEKHGLPLLVHGEVTDPDVDVFDRETVFIDEILMPVMNCFPGLKIVLEHITTSDAVDFIIDTGERIAATITPHHLMYNRNAMFNGGLRPHYYCLPLLKHEQHRQSLRLAVASGNKKFFLGTDSAPHPAAKKHSACGCAGIFSAHAALPLYAGVFEQLGILDKLEAFASFNGADFYGLARNTSTITLHKKSWQVPESYPLGDDIVIPLQAGETLAWDLVD